MPVYVEYWDNEETVKKREEHKNDAGEWHNLNGPSYISWFSNGSVDFEEYCVNNLAHNLNGPARKSYTTSAGIFYEEYWILGTLLAYEEWLKHPLVIQHFINKAIKENLWISNQALKHH